MAVAAVSKHQVVAYTNSVPLAFVQCDPLHQKLGVVRTLLDRKDSVVSTERDKTDSEDSEEDSQATHEDSEVEDITVVGGSQTKIGGILF